MGLYYEHLDSTVRQQMAAELDRDLHNGTLYISPRLTEAGAAQWPALLLNAINDQSDDWLANQLQRHGLIREFEQRAKPKGGFTQARVPHTAADTLAEGEFNRFYARGLCAAVINEGGSEVEVYRGKQVVQPRPDSEAKLGTRVPAMALLNDLRTSQGVEPALGLPPGPNSGLTVRRPG